MRQGRVANGCTRSSAPAFFWRTHGPLCLHLACSNTTSIARAETRIRRPFFAPTRYSAYISTIPSSYCALHLSSTATPLLMLAADTPAPRLSPPDALSAR